jgi:hypothetical protein
MLAQNAFAGYSQGFWERSKLHENSYGDFDSYYLIEPMALSEQL